MAPAQADATRFEREVQQARSEGKLADMQIAQARADQARARLEILQLRLAQCEIRAAFAGVIVMSLVDDRSRRVCSQPP